jgi:hypothetical protein
MLYRALNQLLTYRICPVFIRGDVIERASPIVADRAQSGRACRCHTRIDRIAAAGLKTTGHAVVQSDLTDHEPVSGGEIQLVLSALGDMPPSTK